MLTLAFISKLVLTQYICMWGQPCQPSYIVTGPEQASILVLYGLDSGVVPTLNVLHGGASVDSLDAGTISIIDGTARGVTTTQLDAGTINVLNLNLGTVPTLGGTTTGSWVVYTPNSLAQLTNWGTFKANGSTTNATFGEISVNITGTIGVAGGASTQSITVFDVTASSTLCTCNNALTCTLALNTPTDLCACNATPVSGHLYAIRIPTSTACGTQPVGAIFTVEIKH